MAEKKQRTDKVNYQNRIFTIQGWIVDGVQSALIIRQILTSNWCTSTRHAERMLQQARDEWTKLSKVDILQKRELKIVELQQLKRSMKEQYKGTPAGIRALAAVDKLIIELEGIKPPKKVEVTGKDGQPIQTENNTVVLYMPQNGRTPNEAKSN